MSAANYLSTPIRKFLNSSSIIFYHCKYTAGFPIISISKNVKNILGFDALEFKKNNTLWLDRIHPEDRQEVLSSYRNIKKEQKTIVEFRFRHPTKSYLWLRDEIVFCAKKQHRYDTLIGSSIDITEKKHNEILTSLANKRTLRERERKLNNVVLTSIKEKETLLAEIHHRVKNNLALISGLMDLKIFNTTNTKVKDELLDHQTRIQTIAMIHEVLYKSDSFSAIKLKEIINKLIKNIRKTFSRHKDILIIKEIEDISLSVAKAIPFGMILNELLTNCFKHAFKEKQDGTIWVTFKTKGNNYSLSVCDNGAGLSECFDIRSTKSLGMNLFKTLTTQIEGSFTITSGKRTCFEIRF